MTHFVLCAIAAIAVSPAIAPNPTPKPAQKRTDLHAALRIDADTIGRLFDRGKLDAEKLKDPGFMNATFQRGIGSVRVSVVQHETVSTLNFYTMAMAAYLRGFECRKKYIDEAEAKEDRRHFMDSASTADTVVFTGVLHIRPSFGAKGRVVRRADPEDLKDVRVVLKVGDRIYQPVEQPGDLAYRSESQANLVQVPGFSSAYIYNSSTGQSVTVQSYYTTTTVQGYEQYTAKFAVTFRLFDKDGSARITANDKEITAIVLYGSNERHATYALDDITKFVDERSKPK